MGALVVPGARRLVGSNGRHACVARFERKVVDLSCLMRVRAREQESKRLLQLRVRLERAHTQVFASRRRRRDIEVSLHERVRRGEECVRAQCVVDVHGVGAQTEAVRDVLSGLPVGDERAVHRRGEGGGRAGAQRLLPDWWRVRGGWVGELLGIGGGAGATAHCACRSVACSCCDARWHKCALRAMDFGMGGLCPFEMGLFFVWPHCGARSGLPVQWSHENGGEREDGGCGCIFVFEQFGGCEE